MNPIVLSLLNCISKIEVTVICLINLDASLPVRLTPKGRQQCKKVRIFHDQITRFLNINSGLYRRRKKFYF